MVIDSSVLIALLLGEPETAEFAAAIAASSMRCVSAASYLETAIVMQGRYGSRARALVDRLVDELSLQIVPFSREQAALAIGAYQRYGKGSGHPANLNFGDSFVYALAVHLSEPVLFKGNDFSRTDLSPVLTKPPPR